MISLRAALTGVLGRNADLSLLAGAAELGFDGLFTARDFVASVETGSGQFRFLPIESEGSGDYRADRFRIYFRADQFAALNVATEVNELGRLFPQFFNGSGSEVAHVEGLETNIATTFYRSDKPVNGEPTLQFSLDARVLFSFLDAPDLHDDWVGFIHDNSSSFAVQTLKRNFTQANDVAFGAAAAIALTSAGAAAGASVGGLVGAAAGANPIAGLAAGAAAAILNRYHFLAGRRSWRIGALPPIASPLLPGSTARFYFLETAAVDRFSSWVIDMQAILGDAALGDVDQLTADLWIVMARNFPRVRGYVTDISAWTSEIAAVAGVPFAERRRGVFMDQASFGSKQACLNTDWVQQILHDHPGIAGQF